MAKRNGLKPPVKWVGGKRGLLSQFDKHFPNSFNRYYEPFLGGGGVYFHLKPEKAVLNDVNPDLIILFKTIKHDLDILMYKLKILQKKYHSLNDNKRKKYYYEVRTKFNNDSVDDAQKSAYFIFLNKTGYNGMYRVNSSGKFNVPHGRYKNPLILDDDNLRLVSSALKGAKLMNVDFEKAVAGAKKKDFVYFDPPYYPLNATANFTSYSKDDFGEKDQLRLVNLYKKLDKMGVKVMLSNSFTPFVKKQYKDFRQEVVKANRAINSKANKRGKIKELLILNY